MRIALINENSQLKKNAFIYKTLQKVAQKYGHTVYNYGVSVNKDANINYVGAGFLTGLLLATRTVDFVITGCSSGIGVCMAANSMPNVSCGYVADGVDATLFAKVNAGNAVSIPFGKYFGTGAEINLEQIFHALFKTEFASGYPEERRNIQQDQRKELKLLQKAARKSLYDVLDAIDKDFLYEIIANDYFEENFFAQCRDDEIAEFLKEVLDA